MNTYKLKLAGCLFAFCALWTPHTSEAYFTTDQQAYAVSEDTALFSLSYKFGFAERDLYMPIGAMRNVAANEHFVTGYQLLTDDKTPLTEGTAAGIVLTKDAAVTVVDNQYYVPAGTSATFTLYVIASFADATAHTTSDISLLMTQLPFVMETDDLTIETHLNPSELQYYHTPSISL